MCCILLVRSPKKQHFMFAEQHKRTVPLCCFYDKIIGVMKDLDRKGKNRRPYVMMITYSAAIAALYVVLTLVFAPISFGEIQVRFAEMLTILPLFTPAAIPGLFIGCLLGNILGGAIIWDTIFGSLATLVGAVVGYLLRKNRWLVPIPSILANVIVVPLVLKYGYGVNTSILFLMAYIAIGEILSCYVLGELLGSGLLRVKTKIFPE